MEGSLVARFWFGEKLVQVVHDFQGRGPTKGLYELKMTKGKLHCPGYNSKFYGDEIQRAYSNWLCKVILHGE